MFALVHDVSGVLTAENVEITEEEKKENFISITCYIFISIHFSNTRDDGLDMLRVFPTSLSIPLRRVLDSAVALVLLLDSS